MDEGPVLRRIGDPVVAGAPAGVRIRTRIHPTAAEAEALGAVGELLGSVYRGELAGRVGLGGLDRRAHAVWRAQRKQAVTAVSSSRWAGAITRAVEDQYQLGMRGLAAQVADLSAAVEVLEQRCALRPGELAPRRGRRCPPRPIAAPAAWVSQPRGAVHQDPPPGGAAAATRGGRGGVGGGSAVDHRGWETVVAQPQPPRRHRYDRTAMARALGWAADVFHRRRRVGQGRWQ